MSSSSSNSRSKLLLISSAPFLVAGDDQQTIRLAYFLLEPCMRSESFVVSITMFLCVQILPSLLQIKLKKKKSKDEKTAKGNRGDARETPKIYLS